MSFSHIYCSWLSLITGKVYCFKYLVIRSTVAQNPLRFNPFMTEADIIQKPVHWFGFYMISASVMKGLKIDVFFHFLWQISVYLVCNTKPVLYAEQPVMLWARKHPNIRLLITVFWNLIFISNIFQGTHGVNFDRLSNYLDPLKKEPV